MVACAQALAVAADSEADPIAAELLAAARQALRPPEPAGGVLQRMRRAASRLGTPTRDATEAEVARAIARCWCRLGPPGPALGVVELLPRDAWSAAILDAAKSPDPLAARSAGEAIGAREDFPLAESLAPLLTHPDRAVADAAERSLGALARALSTRGRVERASDAFERALASAARDYPRHRRRGVLELAALLLDPPRLARGAGPTPSPLVAWFRDRDHESHMATRSVVRKSEQPWMRTRAWEWLGGAGEAVAAAALERVTRPGPDGEYEGVLARSHLLANPVRARRVALAAGPRPAAGVIPARHAVPALGTAARRGLVRLVAAVCEDTRGRIGALEPLIADPDAATRLAAARALPPGASLDFCFDADERIAWFAAARGSAAGLGAVIDAGVPSWSTLVRSPHARVRGLAAEELERCEPWDPRSERSRLAARRALAADRPGFVAALRGRITGPGTERRLAALGLVRALGLARDLEAELLAMTAPDPGAPDADRLRATGVAMLAELDSPESLAALRLALNAADGRVRANAVEALARRARRAGPPDMAVADPAAYASLIELKSDAAHRVRANALRALLAPRGAPARFEPAAADAAAGMLRDERPPHRVAALWLAERLLTASDPGWERWGEFASIVADLARADPVVDVRARAGRAAARVLAATRVAWRDRAAALAGGER